MHSPRIEADKPSEVKAGEEINLENLNHYLGSKLDDFPEITGVLQFGGGYSNLTYLLKAGDREFVLRRPPFGAGEIKGGHDMQREYSILDRLRKAGFGKIPETIIFCDEEQVIGSPFYVMSKISGLILRTSQTTKIRESFGQDAMNRLSKSLCSNLAALHKIDIQSTGLVNIGKPEGYIKRQVEGWFKRYLASQTDEIPEIDSLIKWLETHLPKEMTPALIHNDYKFDNVVFDQDDLSLKAILDWEMTTVGDPRMDVGTALSYWSEKGDGDFEKSFNITWLDGNLTRDGFVDFYQEQNGTDLGNILYFYIFGLFKNAVVMQQIYARFRKGLTKDHRFGGLIHGVKRLSEKGINSIEAGKMQ